MEARIEKLEEFVDDARDRLTKIEKRLDQTATKGDLEGLRSEMRKGFADTIRSVVGTAVVMAAARHIPQQRRRGKYAVARRRGAKTCIQK
jgi:hypothetical protein